MMITEKSQRILYKEALGYLDASQCRTLWSKLQEEGDVSSIERSLTQLFSKENAYGGQIAAVSFENHIVSEPLLPPERLLILGAGHVSCAVSKIAASCGFEVTVCDDRADFVTAERFPDAKNRICDSFSHFLEELTITPFDYVLILTRGHACDAECLRKLLTMDRPSYIGLIGSRRRTGRLFEELAAEGFDRSRMEKIFTPVGLSIGAKTPAEIAVSIAAELIACRRQAVNSAGRLCCSSDLELTVLRAVAACSRPAALATILTASGSTPRGAGAKMLVEADGSIVGTIGGGYAENQIRKQALSMIGSGRYRIITVDMSGQIASEDGMVCGGSMRVLIEDII